MFLLLEDTNLSALSDTTLLRKSFLFRDLTLLRNIFSRGTSSKILPP
jgi:hypothetical protein